MKTYNVSIIQSNGSQSDFTVKADTLKKAKAVAQMHKRMEYNNKGKVSVCLAK